MGNLDGLANLLWAGNLGGDLFGDILANFLGDLGTNRPLGPAIFFFRKTRMAFINHNGFAFVDDLGFNFVFHDSDFGTFLFGDCGTFLFGPGFGDIPEACFAHCFAFRHNLEIWDHFGDILTNILTLFLGHHDWNLTGFGEADFLTFLLVPKRYKIKVIKGQFNRVVPISLDFYSGAIIEGI